jgi:predicted transcriptional regulator
MNSESFSQYKRLLERLRWLVAEGQSDSDDAYVIRASMDGLWRTMTTEERRMLAAIKAEVIASV